MSKTTKTIIGIVILVIVLIGIYYLVGRKPVIQVNKETIKIGIVAPLTGGGANFGESLVCGAEVALSEIKDKKYKYELIVEDDETNPAKAATAANKLINIDKIRALITTTSGTGNAVAPVVENAKIPHISVSSDDSITKMDYNFNNLVFPEDEAKALVNVLKIKGINRVALISQIHPGINRIVDSIIGEFKKQQIEIVFKEAVSKEITDFKTTFLKAKGTKPEIYVTIFFPPQIDIVGKVYKELGLKEPITTIAAFRLSSNPFLFEGFWFIDAQAASYKFAEKVREKCPNSVFNPRTTPYGYDSLKILINAFEANKDNPMEYLDNLETYEGEAGKMIKIGRRFKINPLGLWEVKNGSFEELDKIYVE